MAVRIKFDATHNPIHPTIVLATRRGRKIGKIPAKNIVFRDSMNDGSDMSFKVYQADCPELWDMITDFKCVWVRDWNRWFEIEVDVDDTGYLVKSVTAVSLGKAELSQINLYDKEINTEDDISRDDYEPTVFYNPSKPESSLLNRLLEKAPHYHVGHVDTSLLNIQRTFAFNDKTIHDAFQEVAEEIDCLITVDCITGSDGKLQRLVNAYDLKSYCLECGTRGDFLDKCDHCGSANIEDGYGEDTSIFVSTENLADNIKFSTDTGSVKNCFRLEAGDDLTTATIVSCNPNGSGYIWHISDEMKADMSEGLVERIENYDEMYAYYQNEHTVTIPDELLSNYNGLIEKYKVFTTDYKKASKTIIGYPNLMERYFDTIDFGIYLASKLMPDPKMIDTTAEDQIRKITEALLTPVSVKNIESCSAATAESAVLGIAKAVADNRYQIRVSDSTFSNNTWGGVIQVTNYSDEEDAATSARLTCKVDDNYEGYVKQKILKTIKRSAEDATGIEKLFSLPEDQFKAEMKKYCLSRLSAFHDICQGCVDILIEHGIADPSKWAYDIEDLYNGIYIPYYNKLLMIEQEIRIREQEIAVVIGSYDKDGILVSHGMQTFLQEEKDQIQGNLNFDSYLGEDYLMEFSAYRREDTYRNTNYVSDGLNNAELFQLALNFIEVAKADIFKSSTMQHTITAKLKNLLAMKEFELIVDRFEVGNWMRIKTDGKLCKLRFIEYEIDFDNFDDISVDFSDLVVSRNSVSDIESVINQASSMASSYDYVARQAKQGDKSNSQLTDWVERGLALTKMKIVDSADNQNISWDSHGLLCKEYLPITDTYDEKQLKIINRGLYLTDDAWRTSKAGIGDFTYWNPKTRKMEESYGVIADVIVGNIILSETVGIYNKDNSVTMDEDGLVITSNPNVDDKSKQLLLVQKVSVDGDGNESYDKLLYLDDNGDLVLNGSIRINSSGSSGNNPVEDLNDVIGKTVVATRIYYAASEYGNVAPESGWDTIVPDVPSGHFLWTKTETEYGNGDITESYTVSRQGVDGKTALLVYLYKRSNQVPEIDWTQDLVYSFEKKALDAVPDGWSEFVPDGDFPLYITGATVLSSNTTDTIAASEWSAPVVMAKNGADGADGADGSNGTNGLNSATVFLYKRSSTAPAKPSKNSVYTFATGVLSETDGWSVSVPAGNEPCYIVQATAVSSEATDTIAATEWSEPEIFAQNGVKGEDGKDGANGMNTAVVYLYKRSSTAATIDWANTLTYSFASKTLSSVPAGWSKEVPSGADPLYVTAATAAGTDTTDTIAASEWSAPVVMAKNGADGADGADGSNGTNGLNSATVFLYKRSSTAPAKPSKNSVYTFATGVLSETDGWSVSVPAGNEPCYMTHAAAISSNPTDTINSSEWSDPVILSKNGTDGATQYLHIKYSDDGETFTENDGEVIGAWIGMLVDSTEEDSLDFDSYTWRKFTDDVEAELTRIQNLIRNNYSVLQGEINDMHGLIIDEATDIVNDFVNAESERIRIDIENRYGAIEKQFNDQLNAYKAEVGQYMQFDGDGLTLGSTSSSFKTIIDNRGLYFKQGDSVVSYVNNNQLYIPNAVIESTLYLGNFFFAPRGSDGGFSITWQE